MDADDDGFLDLIYGNWNGQHRMFLNAKNGFVDDATPDMATPSRVRTVIAADFDNDGVEELFFNNIPGANRLFTRKAGKWVEINIGDAKESTGHGTGAAVGDFDGDGLLELLISHGESAEEPLTYYRPRAGKNNNWLRVAPLTQFGAPARGALVRLYIDGEETKIRAVDAGSGYLCQMEPVAHFGLGTAAAVSKVEVTWPDGTIQVLPAPTINALLRVPHPNGASATAASPTPVGGSIGTVTTDTVTPPAKEGRKAKSSASSSFSSASLPSVVLALASFFVTVRLAV